MLKRLTYGILAVVLLLSLASCTNLKSQITQTTYKDNIVPENAPSDACGDNLTWRVDEKMTLYIEGEGKMWNFVKYDEEEKKYTSVAAPWAGTPFVFVVFEDGITHIGDYAFSMQNMWYINIPDSVKSIGEGAFVATHNVKTITLGNGVETVGTGAFYGSGAESLSLTNSVKNIEKDAFGECENLDYITFHGTEEEWAELNQRTNAISEIPASLNGTLYTVFDLRNPQ